MESNVLDIGGPSEPATPRLPPLRAWRVTRGHDGRETEIVQAHQLNPEGEMLNFVTYILMGSEPVGQISRLIAAGTWTDVEAITVQPEGASVQ